jgi:predicted dehydrogenase
LIVAGPAGVGLIGAGTISDTYLENLTSFADTEVLAIGDIFPEAAREKAAKYDVAAAGDVATVLDHPDVEIVVNLTHSGGPRGGGDEGGRGRQTRLEREAASP